MNCCLSVLTCEHDEIIIDWALHHFLDLTDVLQYQNKINKLLGFLIQKEEDTEMYYEALCFRYIRLQESQICKNRTKKKFRM